MARSEASATSIAALSRGSGFFWVSSQGFDNHFQDEADGWSESGLAWGLADYHESHHGDGDDDDNDGHDGHDGGPSNLTKLCPLSEAMVRL